MPGSQRGARSAAERFRIVEALGSGGNGSVARAIDEALGTEVALKLLSRVEGLDVFRFKREFRAFAGISHRNLVRLYELFADERQWFFSMELVRGVPFDRFVRPPDGLGEGGAARCPLDEGRLREALYQTADALAAIHRLGKIHRDVKPSNVLVEDGGRVVVLDFGLVTEAGPIARDPTQRGSIVGSPGYMSPEQVRGEALGPASDWYGLGVMLYEALAGARPFEGGVLEVMQRRLEEDAPPPSARGAAVPAELEALCLALLRREASARAGAAEVMAALGRELSAETLGLSAGAAGGELVGREAELAALGEGLARCRQGHSELVLVTGASGMGKTALVEGFLDELDGREALALRGRCYERETLPFQALDGLVDAATSALLREAPERQAELVPAGAAALSRVFPALGRIAAVTERAGLLPREGQELRRRALEGLGELIWRLAGGRTVVLFLDDLQWSDEDSTAALAEVLGELTAIGVLVIATCRAPGDCALGELLARRRLGFAVRELAVGPLGAAEAERLARRAGASDAATAAALVREGGGVPVLLVELGAAAAAGAGTTFEELMARRLAGLDERVRGMLEVCAVAGRPLALDLAAGVSECGDAAAALSALRGARLVRGVPHGAELWIEPAHERLRAAVAAGLSEKRTRELHARLARALEGRDGATAAQRVEHWLAAGERAAARGEASAAAEEAEAAGAFHRAAELWALALEGANTGADEGGGAGANGGGDAERGELARRRVECLARGGQLAAAIGEAAAAAAGATGAARRRWKQLEIECRLRRGDFAGGLAEVRALLREVGIAIPSGRWAVMESLAVQELRLRGPLRRATRQLGAAPARGKTKLTAVVAAAAAGPPTDELERIDLLWAMTSSLVYVSPLMSALLQAHHLRAALQAGERTRVVRALCVELPRRVFRQGDAESEHDGSDGDRDGVALVARLRAEIAALGSAELEATLEMCAGYAAHLRGRWADSVAHARRLEELVRERGGARWMLTVAQIHRVAASWYLGDAAEIVRQMPRYLAEAEAQGDVHSLELLRVTRGNVYWLILDRPDEAQAMAELALSEGRTAGAAGGGDRGDVQLRHYLGLQAHVQIELYRGDGAAAWRRVETVWREFRRSLAMQMRQLRIEALSLRGRAAIAAALVRPADRRALLDEALRCAERLEREELAWARAWAAGLRAAVARGEGDALETEAALDETVARAEGCGLTLLAMAARARRAQWSGGEDGEGGDGLPALARAGFIRPSAVVALLLPG